MSNLWPSVDRQDGRRFAVMALMGAVWAVSTWMSLSLRRAVPPFPIFASLWDDEMQVRLADSIAGGRWLGDWTQTTMSKGPGYPVFLTVAHELGINPMMAAQVLYLAGATVLAAGVLALVRSRVLPTVLYVALAMNPVMFGASASRVYRESLTAALAIVVLGLFVAIAWLVQQRMAVVWRVLVLVPLALLLGLAAGWLTLTRVDTMWILIAVVPVLVASVFWGAATWRERGQHALRWAGVGAVSLGVMFAVGNRVADLNEDRFGVRVTDDYSAGAFAEMSNVWASVRVGAPRTFVPISAAQRAAVYAVSADAAVMKPYLDGKKEFFGRSASCDVAGVCDDYAGGWMPWAMRIAAEKQIGDAVALQAYFGRIRDDITRACGDGRLTCGAHGLGPGVPPLADIDRTLARQNLERVITSGYQGFAAAGLAGEFQMTDDPDTLAVWQRNVLDIPDLLNTTKPWISTETATRVTTLQSRYSRLARLLLVPALLGLLWALFRSGPPRRAAIIGVSVLGACAAHAGLLSVWSAGTGAPTGEDFYLIASVSFFLTGLVIGAWAVVDGCVALVRGVLGRGRPGPDSELTEPHMAGGRDDGQAALA